MDRRKKIQEQITANIYQSHLPKFSIAFDLAARSNSSASHVDRSLLSRKIIIRNIFILFSYVKLGNLRSSSAVDNISIINMKFSDPEFLPIPESITQGNEGTSFDDLEYGANVARW
jgi:hypothetical protein